MLNISDTLKQIYKNDLLPIVDSIAPKDLTLYIPSINLTIETDRIKDDSFVLNESLCSDSDLTLGSCEAAQLKVTVADVVHDLKDQVMIVTQTVNGIHQMPLGTYIVDSVQKQADLRFKEIVAYDAMKGTSVDVSGWYNLLTFPITKKNMLNSLLTHLGIEYETQALPNDNVLLEKTINPSYLKGRDVLMCLCALSGGFGHITRLNKFKTILLSGLGLYPSETLYPAEDLFPSESNEFITAGYMESEYEEYIVEPITGIKIVQDDEDYGTMVGTSENIYTITGNFLLYGKSSTELKTIAENILLVVKNKYYRPHKTKMIGLPYIEVGDAINIITTDDAIETFVFQRTLKGIQALTDEISATGNKIRDNKPSPNNEIQQLKGKTLKIVKSIEELSSTMTDVEQDLESKITQTAGQIRQEVSNLEDDLYSELNVQAGKIDLKVSNSGIIAAINLSQEGIKIDASKLTITGYVTFNNLSTSGQTTIHGGNLQTGTVIADTVRASWIYAGDINANQIKAGTISGDRINGGTITGVTINGSTLVSTGSSYSTTIESGIISTTYINVSQGGGSYATLMDSGLLVKNNNTGGQTLVGTGSISTDSLLCSKINGYTPIHSGNISSQSVSNAQLLGYTIYVSSNSNMIPNASGVYCGTSGNPFAGGYATGSWATTSDERKKYNISDLDERYIRFAKMITPRMFQMLDGTSGRYHTGLVAQEVEQSMLECNISDTEFAGLVKSPRYAIRLFDGEYDTASEIIDYDYFLRYEEFIPLLFLLFKDINK